MFTELRKMLGKSILSILIVKKDKILLIIKIGLKLCWLKKITKFEEKTSQLTKSILNKQMLWFMLIKFNLAINSKKNLKLDYFKKMCG